MTINSEKFWRKVKKAAPDECWVWTAYKDKDGYGRERVMGTPVGAHRLSYIIAHGAIPAGMLVCHRCDNPSCVNPNHLWLGTHADNHRDRDAKGRSANRRGERNYCAKMSDQDAAAIRTLLARGDLTQKAIAEQYGIDPSTVSRINAGSRWRGE